VASLGQQRTGHVYGGEPTDETWETECSGLISSELPKTMWSTQALPDLLLQKDSTSPYNNESIENPHHFSSTIKGSPLRHIDLCAAVLLARGG